MRTYQKNKRGEYWFSPVNYFWFWAVVCFLVFGLSLFLPRNNFIFNAIRRITLILSICFLSIDVVKVIIGSFRNASLLKYIYSLNLESSIREALLNTMTLNLRKDSPTIDVPEIRVIFDGDKINVYVQRLPGMNDIDKVEENINSSFRGKFEPYAVTTKIQRDDGTGFEFVLEDVGTDKTFCPKTVQDLRQKQYFVTLQKGLTINLSKYPHLVVWGKTGSGKTTVLLSIIAQCLSNGTNLLFIDGKTEFSSFSAFYPSEKIATDNEHVLKLLKGVAETITQRQRIVADEVKRRRKLGLTGFDVGLKPVVVIADEINSIIVSMNSKQKKELISYLTQITQKGRSVSVFLVLATQSPATDVLPSGIRNQFSTRILLSSATGDVQRMAFDQVATSGDVGPFQGYYMLSGRTVQPQKYYVPNLKKYGLDDLEAFEKLYKS